MTKPVWRVGTKVYRTIYRDDVLVGVMDTPELAQQVVEALNGVAPAPCGDLKCLICCPKPKKFARCICIGAMNTRKPTLGCEVHYPKKPSR